VRLCEFAAADHLGDSTGTVVFWVPDTPPLIALTIAGL
jgi:hypothetical protein